MTSCFFLKEDAFLAAGGDSIPKVLEDFENGDTNGMSDHHKDCGKQIIHTNKNNECFPKGDLAAGFKIGATGGPDIGRAHMVAPGYESVNGPLTSYAMSAFPIEEKARIVFSRANVTAT